MRCVGLLCRQQSSARNRIAVNDDGVDLVIGGNCLERIGAKEEQVGALADFDRAAIRRESESFRVIKRCGGENLSKWNARVCPMAEFKPSI
jgi:hypothetical protein